MTGLSLTGTGSCKCPAGGGRFFYSLTIKKVKYAQEDATGKTG